MTDKEPKGPQRWYIASPENSGYGEYCPPCLEQVLKGVDVVMIDHVEPARRCRNCGAHGE